MGGRLKPGRERPVPEGSSDAAARAEIHGMLQKLKAERRGLREDLAAVAEARKKLQHEVDEVIVEITKAEMASVRRFIETEIGILKKWCEELDTRIRDQFLELAEMTTPQQLLDFIGNRFGREVGSVMDERVGAVVEARLPGIVRGMLRGKEASFTTEKVAVTPELVDAVAKVCVERLSGRIETLTKRLYEDGMVYEKRREDGNGEWVVGRPPAPDGAGMLGSCRRTAVGRGADGSSCGTPPGCGSRGGSLLFVVILCVAPVGAGPWRARPRCRHHGAGACRCGVAPVRAC